MPKLPKRHHRFDPRPRERVDLPTGWATEPTTEFRSTPPGEGATVMSCELHTPWGVSIHAPLRERLGAIKGYLRYMLAGGEGGLSLPNRC